MTFKPTDSILGPPRGTPAEAIAYALSHGALRLGDVTAYVNEVYRLGPLTGVDPAIAISQSAHETDIWRSSWWRDRLNPAGIGITGDPEQNAASHTWTNGVEAARSQIAHLLLYATGRIDRSGLTPDDDPRYDAYIAAYGAKPTATTIDALAGRWAADTDYASGIVRHGNAMFLTPDQGGSSVTDLTFKKVPHPAYTNRVISDADNSAWNNLGTRSVRAVVWHRMLGSLWGTDGYFRGEGGNRALTDYGVGVEAQDGAGDDGHILKWNEPLGYRAPWANGVVSAPYGDGIAFVNRYGIDAVNRDATAIEISGFQTTPLSEKSRNAIAGLTAYWADQYKVPWDAFPLIAGEGNRSFVVWHQEFTIGTGKLCPFDVVIAETAALIERTRAILKKYQAAETKPAPKPPAYAAPDVPDWMAADLEAGFPTDHVHNGVQVFAALRQYEAIKATKRRQNASLDADVVGPPLKVRERFTGWYWSKSPDGKRTWVWTPYGTRIDAAALTPRLSLRKA
jgi:hypothetical protein